MSELATALNPTTSTGGEFDESFIVPSTTSEQLTTALLNTFLRKDLTDNDDAEYLYQKLRESPQ